MVFILRLISFKTFLLRQLSLRIVFIVIVTLIATILFYVLMGNLSKMIGYVTLSTFDVETPSNFDLLCAITCCKWPGVVSDFGFSFLKKDLLLCFYFISLRNNSSIKVFVEFNLIFNQFPVVAVMLDKQAKSIFSLRFSFVTLRINFLLLFLFIFSPSKSI